MFENHFLCPISGKTYFFFFFIFFLDFFPLDFLDFFFFFLDDFSVGELQH